MGKITRKVMDLTGEAIGDLEVLYEAPVRVDKRGANARYWVCKCKCGVVKEMPQASLRIGTSSCGCLRLKRARAAHQKHDLSRSKQYRVWASMKDRCNNPNSLAYKNYGGRGITYEPKWETFSGFWEDMEEGYEEGLTLERLSNNLGYCKSNCEWVSRGRQAKNKRMRSNNSSGVTGVSLISDTYKDKEYLNWIAQWTNLEGKRRYKCFSANKYGYDRAFGIACLFRAEMIKELNAHGLGYSEQHGL